MITLKRCLQVPPQEVICGSRKWRLKHNETHSCSTGEVVSGACPLIGPQTGCESDRQRFVRHLEVRPEVASCQLPSPLCAPPSSPQGALQGRVMGDHVRQSEGVTAGAS